MGNAKFVLGLLGGIFGFISAFIGMAFGSIGKALNANGASTISGLAVSAIIFSILGIIGASISGKKPKAGGWLMLISGIAILISISLFGILPFILLLIGGIMALREKSKK